MLWIRSNATDKQEGVQSPSPSDSLSLLQQRSPCNVPVLKKRKSTAEDLDHDDDEEDDEEEEEEE